MIYLDNAATGGKKPERVIKAVERALRHHCANPGRSGHTAALAAGEIVFDCRRKTARFFGAEQPEHVCFTSGCTAALNMALKGILQKGDRIVFSSMEHNAVVRPLHSLKELGVFADEAAVTGDSAATLENFKEAIKPETKAIVCTHASNVTGEIMPIAELGELCRQRGLIFIVDAAQTAGVLPIHMEKAGIHILCAAPHKGLLSPMGLGLLISRVPLPQTIIQGGTGSLSLSPEQPQELPERIESGTLNLPAIAGLSAALDILASKGTDASYRRELNLARFAYKSLASIPRVTLYTPPPEYGKNVPVISFNISGLGSAETAEKLSRMGIATRGGLHCAPKAHKTLGTEDIGTVRISFSYFNTMAEVAALTSAVRQISKTK